MESILVTIRDMLGIDKDYDGFDIALLAGINAAIFSLLQLGIGPSSLYVVTGVDETWEELYDGVENLNAVISYVHIKTKLSFDTPSSSYHLRSLEAQAAELEQRLAYQVEPAYESDEE